MYKTKALPPETQEKIKVFIGREITLPELNFLPYFISTALCNNIDERELTTPEKDIINKWVDERLVIFLGYGNIKMTERFFKAIFIALQRVRTEYRERVTADKERQGQLYTLAMFYEI